ncbi:hypothetical protein AMIS_42980 [Actinoplanes missouriensis 431]|uniref:Uncharacterized protein n=1 Tax=Actinoplanes missouriensis (strain ATCC 14538 / DSM 43046 / CBS 188.64 / JCM 3121 / NBRC 102363 / NCIMB 12654 / NRRL B-3342 / UNCC 431) TaxID=512565 RepID=I0H931_ACTM4|nr:hypothetical protein [Actinoplanes missouriensis]BAL89518.1 hypothetical protein AMIS_42980 [Actinoplanes missouriensis 431]
MRTDSRRSLNPGGRLPNGTVMPKFQRMTFPTAQPDARVVHTIAPTGRITRRPTETPRDEALNEDAG